MKIGKFVASNNLTKDTVRHYMDLGLLVPEKQGGQYDFDSKCQKDIEDIITLKGMGFYLNEIKSIFLFKRLAKLTPFEEEHYYKELFINKEKQIAEQINEFTKIKQKLELKLKQLSETTNKESSVLGINIKSLHLFKCTKCGNSLNLSKGNIENNQVINGNLSCVCGQEYIIEDGILMVGDIVRNTETEINSNFVTEYITDTSNEYLDNFYRGMKWLYNKIDFNNFHNKIALELGSGVGFFLRYIYDDLSDDTTYIAIDYDINKHRFLKTLLEIANCKKNIIFICSDFLQIPIYDKSIDILLDLSGTSNYSFCNENFLLSKINNYVKEDAYIIGTYILFKNFVLNSLVEDEYKKNFTLSTIKEEISKLQYHIIEEHKSSYIDKGGKYENYFKSGEKIYSYSIIGQR